MRFVTGLIRRPMGWPPYRTVTNKRPVIYTLLRGVGDAAPYHRARQNIKFIMCNKTKLQQDDASIVPYR